MEKDLADLSLADEEEEILQAHGQIGSVVEDIKFCLVGCFLTASVIHFPTMRNTMTNLWHLVKGVQISDLGEKSEAMARQLSDFLGKFVKYDNARHDDSFCSARMPLRVEVAMMGWDLSLRAQSKRALIMNIIWLKEEEGEWDEGISTTSIDPIFAVNLKAIDHDLEESAIEEGKEKKWAKRESDVCTNETNMGSLVVREEKGIRRNYLLSTIAKGQANRSQ
ncbi:hypothetical protein Goari_014266 [Gossypium aridum]|uniref:Uncharacterized protein n=1 Tax=Gossypium aridum TaxID=34290 RepID=A0A7J8XH92_GOSAI|nr:hypothetical protein [Gossypium aridum]